MIVIGQLQAAAIRPIGFVAALILLAPLALVVVLVRTRLQPPEGLRVFAVGMEQETLVALLPFLLLYRRLVLFQRWSQTSAASLLLLARPPPDLRSISAQ